MRRVVAAVLLFFALASIVTASTHTAYSSISGEIEGALVVKSVRDCTVTIGRSYEVHVPIANRTGAEVCITDIVAEPSDGITVHQHERRGGLQDGYMEGPCLPAGTESYIFVSFTVEPDAPLGAYHIDLSVVSESD